MFESHLVCFSESGTLIAINPVLTGAAFRRKLPNLAVSVRDLQNASKKLRRRITTIHSGVKWASWIIQSSNFSQ
jgi:hypothetical protein